MLTSFGTRRQVAAGAARIAPILALALTAGCVTAPDAGPRAEMRDAASIGAGESLAATPGAEWPESEWWREYRDPQLDTLIAEGLANSPDVAAASARMRRAVGLAREAGAPLFPAIDAEGSVYKERRSLNNGFGDEIKRFLPSGWRDGGDAAVRLDYELDIWGRNRAGLAAATSEARAAEVEAREAQLMLTAAIASAYAQLAQRFAERDIRKSTLDIRLTTRDLVADRHANGLEMRGSLLQAEAGVASAKSALSAAEQALVLQRNLLALLVGAGPDRGRAIARPAFAAPVSAGLPLDATTGLVSRRPDIVAARARAEAAAARVRVARAGFFPAIRLQGLIGFQSIGLDDLFTSDSSYGRAGPAISLPIFRGGQLRGRYRAERGAFDAAVADYDATVLSAYREVADAVTTRSHTAAQLVDAGDALEASQGAYEIARLRYDGGLSSYLDVLAIEDRMLTARLDVARLEAEARLSEIALVRALGGGFAAQPTRISQK